MESSILAQGLFYVVLVCFYSQQLLLHWRQTLNQNVYLGLVNVMVSPRVCSMLPGENCDVKIPTQLTKSCIDRLPRPHRSEGQRTAAENGHTRAALAPQ